MATRLKEWMLLCWKAVRQTFRRRCYERYLAHHAARHADRSPLSRREYFRRSEREKWKACALLLSALCSAPPGDVG